MNRSASNSFVSRGGDKLTGALNHFALSVESLICADFGSHVGGFVDCLLQRGAEKVYSVDTSYGTLAWKIRRNSRVVVLERSNAMHVELPELSRIVTIDVGWTPQKKILPAARRNLHPDGQVLTLIKPHYEAAKEELVDGVLPAESYTSVVSKTLRDIASWGWYVEGNIESSLLGHGGNREHFALLSLSKQG